MTTITPEIRQAIEQAGDSHLELFDLSTNKTYFLVTAEWLQSIRDWLKPWDDGEDYEEYRNLLPATGEGEPHSNPSP